ncbi:Protein of unknown function [Alteribacillus persepolensis]|uniref:DUF1659 domain-containing protein n=1 Tax=Alteribacillus persepolensis TaxID=568899 RepID=A0A1G8GLJ0_9BACI|nr:DUF1659 domain-containing protein [Alteribacillus persepolensis]SDH95259.1 Protein of unknown function [Alteribacillus persepolensis]
MADILNSRLTLELNEGNDENGNVMLKYKHFNNVKTTALDEDLHDVAVALGALQAFPVVSMKRVNEYDLSTLAAQES